MKTAKVKITRKGVVFLAVVTLLLWIASTGHALENVRFVQELRKNLERPIDVVVAPSGDIYVLDRKLATVVVYDSQGQVKMQFAEKGYQPGNLFNPSALAISPRGEIIIADTGNNRVQIYGPNGYFLYELGSSGSMPGHFSAPDSVAVNPSGFIFIGDSGNKSISKFSPGGVFLEVYKLSERPKDMVFDLQDNMYLLMRESGRILKHTPHMVISEEITYVQENQNIIKNTAGIAVDMRGDIYLIEDRTLSIKKIEPNAELLFSFGSGGIGRGQFDAPAGITADHAGRIYVADTENARVQIMEVTGSEKPLMKAANTVQPLIDFEMAIAAEETIVDLDYVNQRGLYALSDEHGRILLRGADNKTFQETEENPLEFNNPKALFVAGDGRMLVADTGNHRLQFLNPDGTLNYNFGSRGKANGEFNALQGVAVDREGLIYVADTRNNRIQIFNRDGIYLRTFGQRTLTDSAAGPSHGTFKEPIDLVFDSKDRLHILDSGNKRIQIFKKDGEYVREIGGTGDLDNRFIEPVDIAIDESDYLYVADRGDFTVKILNPKGEHLLVFGSSGKGPSYFPKLSAIAAANGKIYVADYKVDEIKVFRFDPQGIGDWQERPLAAAMPEPVLQVEEPVQEEVAASPWQLPSPQAVIEKTQKEKSVELEPVSSNKILTGDRISTTKYSYLMDGETEEMRYAAARDVILESATRELAYELGVPRMTLDNMLDIEKEEVLPSGMLKITVSVPKQF